MRLVTPGAGADRVVDQPLLQMFDLILLCLMLVFVAPGVPGGVRINLRGARFWRRRGTGRGAGWRRRIGGDCKGDEDQSGESNWCSHGGNSTTISSCVKYLQVER